MTAWPREKGRSEVVSDRDKLLGLPSPRQRRPSAWIILTGPVTMAVALGAAFLPGSTVANDAQSAAVLPSARETQQSRQSMASENPAATLPKAAPGVVDLSSPVHIGGGDCSFGPTLDRAIRSMIVYEGDPPVARAGRVDLAGRQMIPALIAARDEGVDRPDFRSHEASVQLSPAATWNGLRLTGLRSRTGWEWSASSLEFADSPARVQAALRAMSIAIPLPPGRRDIPTDACSASIAVEARSHGSALTCSAGC